MRRLSRRSGASRVGAGSVTLPRPEKLVYAPTPASKLDDECVSVPAEVVVSNGSVLRFDHTSALEYFWNVDSDCRTCVYFPPYATSVRFAAVVLSKSFPLIVLPL
jgi:hypothetical protein